LIRSGTARAAGGDVLPTLLAYVVVLVAIPSELIVRPLGAAGTPAQIIGVAMFGWWAISRLVGRGGASPSNPVKWLLLLFAVSILASYVAGMSRPITFAEEVSSADRALLSLAAWCGVALVLADGIATRSHLETLLRVAAAGITGIAVLGMLQFFLNIDIAHIIAVPGLSANHQFGQLAARSAYRRVTGTTAHPIEFGVVLSASLPLLIHFARFAPTKAGRRRWWIAATAVAVALPLSVARSGILGALIAVIYLFHTWPPRLKLRMAVAGGIGAFAMSFAVPGLLGTIKSLFVNASSDPSTQGRTADYAPVERYTAQHPLFGRGFGTFIPSIYRTLDNQILGSLVETGIVGLVCLIVLFVGTGSVAGSVRRRSSSERTRDLAQSLKAGIAVIGFNFATFDALGFPMCAGLLFVFIGCTASLWATETTGAVSRAGAAERGTRWPVLTSAVVVLVVALGLSARGVMDARPEYQAYGALLVTTRPVAGQSTLTSAGNTNMMTSILHDVLASRPIRDTLRPSGSDYQVAVGKGSLMMDTDVQGGESPTLRVLATGASAAQADAGLAAVVREATNQLARLQAAVGVPTADMLRMQVIQQTTAFPVGGRPTRAHAVFGLLALIVVAAFLRAARRYRGPRRTPAPRTRGPVRAGPDSSARDRLGSHPLPT
jgi:O-antigen ligase